MEDSTTFLLPVSLFAPLVVAFLLLIGGRLPLRFVKLLACIGLLTPFLISLVLWKGYAAALKGPYAYLSEFAWGHESASVLRLQLGLNGVSLPLYVLSATVGLAAGLYTLTAAVAHLRVQLMLVLFITAGALGAFASVNVFYYYFFHEISLIPTFIAIGLFGGKGKRAAAIEMAVYLVGGGLLALVGLIAVYYKVGSFSLIDFLRLQPLLFSESFEITVVGLWILGFGTLAALFPFHSWAPNTYAAAPAAVSMLHAGVLKCFGIYGLLQVVLPLCPMGLAYWKNTLIALALGNSVFIGFVTISQVNIKRMISYSSVMHIGYSVLGIACVVSVSSNPLLPLTGVVLLMVGHGLSTALLFLLAGLLYQRTQTYDLSDPSMGGFYRTMPLLCLLFGMAFFASIGLPGFTNFWGEVLVFISLGKHHPWVLGAALSGLVLSAVYSLRCFSKVFLGPLKTTTQALIDIRPLEACAAMILLAGSLFIGFFPSVIAGNITAPSLLKPPVLNLPEPFCMDYLTTSQGDASPALKEF